MFDRTRQLFQPCSLPEGRRGEWAIERFTVSEEAARMENLRAAIGSSSRGIEAGTYTRLIRGEPGSVTADVVMSDTPAEIEDHLWAVWRARGDVLVLGLGLGTVVQALLVKQSVTSVTVVELAPDLIDLVGSHFTDARLRIVEGDAWTWEPPTGAHYELVWADIWDGIHLKWSNSSGHPHKTQ